MYRVYRVELEDTLDSIADKFNTTIDSLRQLNGKNIEDMIIPNNYIIVPKDEQGVFEVYKIKKEIRFIVLLSPTMSIQNFYQNLTGWMLMIIFMLTKKYWFQKEI